MDLAHPHPFIETFNIRGLEYDDDLDGWTSGEVVDLDAPEGPAARTPGREATWRVTDIAEVLGAWVSEDDSYDGECAGLVRLNDGRFVAWESWWGPTGNGFGEDAYGGDSDVFVSRSLDKVIAFGLTDDGRRVLGLTLPV